MGGTSTANEHYLTGDERYQYRKWALSEWGWKIPVPQISIPDWWWGVPVPQMSIIWIRMKDTVAANEHFLNGDGSYRYRKWALSEWGYRYRKLAYLTGDERHAANGDDLSAALTQLYQHWLNIAAQLFDTVVFRLCLQNLRIRLEAR
jgi:hypothetical protein